MPVVKSSIDNYIDTMKPYLWNPAKWAHEVCRYDLDAWQVEYLEMMVAGKFSVIAGCNGCLSYGTPLLNADTGEEVPIGEIDGPFPVWSYWHGRTVRAVAEKPFIKGVDDLYRVTLSNGKEFTCTLDHKVLTPMGWKAIRELQIGSECVAFPIELERSDSLTSLWPENVSVQSTHGACGPRWLNTIQDSQSGCQSEYQIYDGPFHQVGESAQCSFPLPTDAHGHTQYYWRMDGRCSLSGYNHAYRQSCRLSKNYCDQDLPQSLVCEEYPNESSFCEFPKQETQVALLANQFLSTDARGEMIHIHDHEQRLAGVIVAPMTLGYGSANCSSITTIQSITFVRQDIFYDLHVPVTNNYLASGIFHHNSGKDFISSIFALFMLSLRPMLKGQVTGPNREQIFDVVWAECHKIINRSAILPSVLRWEKTHIRNRLAPEEWFLTAKTASKRFSSGGGDAQAEGIQGIRGLFTLVLLTEASGVEDPNFEAARSCCATPNAYLGVVGNPLRRSGFFYELFHQDVFDGWFRRHVDYTESSFTDKEQMAQWITEYGMSSSFVTARCFGQFPLTGADDTAIAWALIKAAMDRESPLAEGDGLQVGVDPARGGKDEAVICVRRGYVVFPLIVFTTCTGGQLVQAIVDAIAKYGGNYDTPINVDESGLGGMGVSTHYVIVAIKKCMAARIISMPNERIAIIPGMRSNGWKICRCFSWMRNCQPMTCSFSN